MLARSLALALNFMATASSWMISPALGLTMAPPIRTPFLSVMTLTKPLNSFEVLARPKIPVGARPILYLMPFCFSSVSVTPTEEISGLR